MDYRESFLQTTAYGSEVNRNATAWLTRNSKVNVDNPETLIPEMQIMEYGGHVFGPTASVARFFGASLCLE